MQFGHQSFPVGDNPVRKELSQSHDWLMSHTGSLNRVSLTFYLPNPDCPTYILLMK